MENCLNIIQREKPDKVLAQGKWQIVTQLTEQNIEIAQIPLSRTTRSENIGADYMAVISKINGQTHLFGIIGVDQNRLFSFAENSVVDQQLDTSAIDEEANQIEHDGIFSVMLKKEASALKVISCVPVAIQDLPFLSLAFNQDFAGMITEITLTGTYQIEEHPVRMARYHYEHVYPYKQFGLTQPQKAPYSLAIGAKLEQADS